MIRRLRLQIYQLCEEDGDFTFIFSLANYNFITFIMILLEHYCNTILNTCVRSITCSASTRHGKVMSSMLGLLMFYSRTRSWCSILDISKEVKGCTYCCYVRCATLIATEYEECLGPNRRNSLPGTGRTLRQRSYNQRVGCLPCSTAS